MDFNKYSVPRNVLRNGYLNNKTSNNTININSGGNSNVIGGGGSIITNYLPAFYNVNTEVYDVIDGVNFSNENGWTFKKRTSITDENGEVTITETPLLTINSTGLFANVPIYSTKEIMAYNYNNTEVNSIIKETLNNVENATTLEDIKTILINLRNVL